MTNIEKEKIRYLRCEGLGYKAIASRLGISENTVKGFCRREGLTGDFLSQTGKCRHCNGELAQNPKGKPKKFCCEECRRAWWKARPYLIERRAFYTTTCAHCAKPFESYGNKGRKYCSHSCYVQARFGKGASA